MDNGMIDHYKTHYEIKLKPKLYVEYKPIIKENHAILKIDKLLALFPIETKIFIEEYIDETSANNIDDNIIKIELINSKESKTKIGDSDNIAMTIEAVKLLGGGYAILENYKIQESPKDPLIKYQYIVFTFDRPINNLRIYFTNIIIEVTTEPGREEKESYERIKNRISLIRQRNIIEENSENNKELNYIG